MNVVKALHRAREAYERREWLTAYKTLSDLDNTALAATDFIRLADTAELLGHSNDAVQALQRAHHAALGAGEPIIATRAIARLAMLLALRGETAVAGGWLATGERLLEEISDDVVEQGYLLVARMLERVGVGDLETAAKVPPKIIDLRPPPRRRQPLGHWAESAGPNINRARTGHRRRPISRRSDDRDRLGRGR